MKSRLDKVCMGLMILWFLLSIFNLSFHNFVTTW